MRKEDKNVIIANLGELIAKYPHFYIVDTEGLNAEQTTSLRRLCFKQNVKMVTVKNTLFQKALEAAEVDFSPLYDALKGTSSVLFTEVANVPGKMLKNNPKSGIKLMLRVVSMAQINWMHSLLLRAKKNSLPMLLLCFSLQSRMLCLLFNREATIFMVS